MKKSMIIGFLLLLIPIVHAQEFMDIAGTYETYWQWFDLAIWVTLFTSLAQWVFVQRMSMHKGIAIGIGLALGLSMLMLEVYSTNFRLALLSPYAVLVVAILLWIMLWQLLNAVVAAARS